MTSSSTSSSPPLPAPDDYLFQSHYQPNPSHANTPNIPHLVRTHGKLLLLLLITLSTPLQHNFFAPLLQPTTYSTPALSLPNIPTPTLPPHNPRFLRRRTRARPPRLPKVPTYEYYGFVLYLFSSLTFLLYLLWSYLPSPFLHALGIYYYPNRWWSLALPSWIVMLLVYIYVALASYNTGYLTLGMNSVETIIDGAANVCLVDGRGMAAASHASQEENLRERERERRRGKERERERGTGYLGGSAKEREREKGGYIGGGKEADVRAWKKFGVEGLMRLWMSLWVEYVRFYMEMGGKIMG